MAEVHQGGVVEVVVGDPEDLGDMGHREGEDGGVCSVGAVAGDREGSEARGEVAKEVVAATTAMVTTGK